MKLVILDRDGVINEDSDAYIKSPAEWVPIAGSLEAIARLNHAGFRVVVATNQSGIARGLFDMGTLDAIHQRLHGELARVGGQLDGIYFCPHGPDDRCTCRKPEPGLFEEIALRTGTAFLVRTGKGSAAEHQLPPDWGVPVYDDLAAVVTALLDGEPR